MERDFAGTRCFGDEALRLRAQAALPEIKSRIKGWNDAMYAERSDFLVERYGFDRGMVNRITDPQFGSWLTMRTPTGRLHRRRKRR